MSHACLINTCFFYRWVGGSFLQPSLEEKCPNGILASIIRISNSFFSHIPFLSIPVVVLLFLLSWAFYILLQGIRIIEASFILQKSRNSFHHILSQSKYYKHKHFSISIFSSNHFLIKKCFPNFQTKVKNSTPIKKK